MKKRIRNCSKNNRIFDCIILREELVGGFKMEVYEAEEDKRLEVFKEIKSEIVFSSKRIAFLLVDLKPGQIVHEYRHPHAHPFMLKKALLLQKVLGAVS